MAIATFDSRKGNADFDKLVHTGDHENPLSKMLTEIANKLDEIVNKINSIDTAVSANTSKTSMTLGTTGSTALAGDTRIPAFTADDTSVAGTTKSTSITFGNFTTTVVGKTTTYSLPITVTETTVVSSGKGAGKTTLTKTGSITLT